MEPFYVSEYKQPKMWFYRFTTVGSLGDWFIRLSISFRFILLGTVELNLFVEKQQQQQQQSHLE